MSRSLLGGGAAVAVALLSASLIFHSEPSIAEPLASAVQGQEQTQKGGTTTADEAAGRAAREAEPAAAPAEKVDKSTARLAESAGDTAAAGVAQHFVATAYSLRGRTASGRNVERGIIAADRRVLPLGTRVRLDAGNYSGEYLVADTGGLVRGRKIDIWVPNSGEAMRFGRRPVKLTVLTYGGRRATPKPAIRVR